MRTDPDYSKLVSITKMSTTKPYVQRLLLFRIIPSSNGLCTLRV